MLRSAVFMDLVADAGPPDGRTDAADDTGDVVAEDERCPVGEEHFELAVADFRVEEVDTGGVDVDEHVVAADRWFGRLTGRHRAFVFADQVGLHRVSR
jgi:hypothetical protein